jgi:Anti-sigma factor NepR
MPVLQDWSWQMRKRASPDRRNGKGPHLSVVGGSKMAGNKPVTLEAGVQAHIGSLLRAMYDSALKEPVPDRFVELLRQMDSRVGDDTPPPAAGHAEPK